MKRLAVLFALSALAGGCSSGEPTGPTASPAPQRPRSTGTLRFIEPTHGARLSAGDVRVKLVLTGATLLKEASTDVRPDTGHVHLILDGKTITLLAGLEVRINDIEGVGTLSPGDHLLQAEFAAADHGPFSPRVLTQVTFTAA